MGAWAFIALQYPQISFLWHNVIGVVVVTAVGLAVSVVQPRVPPSGGTSRLRMTQVEGIRRSSMGGDGPAEAGPHT
jgi:hypothetical protein